MLTKKELGIPWRHDDPDYIISDNDVDLFDVLNAKENQVNFIILAANNYHALVEALEWALGEIKFSPDCLRFGGCDTRKQVGHCRFCKRYKDFMAELEPATALLATHTQQEARQGDESKDTAHTAINDNKPVE